ncbi:hypothetical protein RUMHYD_01961 [Blautia hydrogenotrophica DSM 10507]|uniref:Uncharacterized protein n=1 Tax=Blautia hydrogenotrophica (strain DSM 10507 / JCM 14656 / S5a33) TaxID=476272 RepID=C0CM80_BLAHS|nr:hypothetical protein RUMHYD_01961 [Blautia hydrogenotrophica DSM 10507]
MSNISVIVRYNPSRYFLRCAASCAYGLFAHFRLSIFYYIIYSLVDFFYRNPPYFLSISYWTSMHTLPPTQQVFPYDKEQHESPVLLIPNRLYQISVVHNQQAGSHKILPFQSRIVSCTFYEFHSQVHKRTLRNVQAHE